MHWRKGNSETDIMLDGEIDHAAIGLERGYAVFFETKFPVAIPPCRFYIVVLLFFEFHLIPVFRDNLRPARRVRKSVWAHHFYARHLSAQRMDGIGDCA